MSHIIDTKSSHGHYRTICKDCKEVIGQCRCNSLNKEIKYGICDKCKMTEETKDKFSKIKSLDELMERTAQVEVL